MSNRSIPRASVHLLSVCLRSQHHTGRGTSDLRKKEHRGSERDEPCTCRGGSQTRLSSAETCLYCLLLSRRHSRLLVPRKSSLPYFSSGVCTPEAETPRARVSFLRALRRKGVRLLKAQLQLYLRGFSLPSMCLFFLFLLLGVPRLSTLYWQLQLPLQQVPVRPQSLLFVSLAKYVLISVCMGHPCHSQSDVYERNVLPFPGGTRPLYPLYFEAEKRRCFSWPRSRYDALLRCLAHRSSCLRHLH